MNIQTALLQGVRLLEEAAVASPRLTAEILLCQAIRRERSWLYGHPEEELSEIQWIHYGRYLHERIQGKPAQYITGRQEFYGRMFRVTPAVLIPRPETEHVVEAVLRLGGQAPRIVDIGCGSGAIAVTLALERPAASVWATDISGPALKVAADNAARLGARVAFIQCDLCTALRSASVDVIVSNPPYVSVEERASLQREVRDYEPEVALYAGRSGMEFYERLVDEAGRVLQAGGWLVMELGYQSLDPVRRLLNHGWEQVEITPDLAGIPRVLAVRRSS